MVEIQFSFYREAKLDIAVKYLVILLEILIYDLGLWGGTQGVKRNDLKETGLAIRSYSWKMKIMIHALPSFLGCSESQIKLHTLIC